MKRLHGFTLVELLIVLSIIIVLSIAAVVAFTGGREKVSLNLIVDQFVTEIQKLETWTRTGFGENLGERSKCYVVEFKNNKIPEFLEGIFVQDKCENLKFLERIKLDPKLLVKNLTLDTAMKDSFTLEVLPPNGKFNFKPDGNILSFHIALSRDGDSHEVKIIRASKRITR